MKIYSTVLLLTLSSGCVSWFQPTISFDSRSISIQTLSLFDQRQNSNESKASWAGDWIFRRERLDLVDQALRNEKPDIFLAQNMMTRRGSPSESDELILLAGALRGYQSKIEPVHQYEDTLEDENLGIFVAAPTKIEESPTTKRQLWGIGADGFVSATVLQTENEPIVVFNVQMPSRIGRKFLWYTFIQERITEFLQQGNYCRERVVVGGYLPADQGAVRFQNFLQALDLRDTGLGYCAIASSCFTGTPTNELFVVTNPDEPGAQFDRILVNSKTTVSSASRNIVSSEPSSAYARQYGLNRLWAVQRFGWHTTVRMPRCGAQ